MSKIMKDSGIEWIREIPEDWKWKRLKNMVSNLGGGNYGEDIKTLDKESVLSKCFSISDFKNGNLNLGNSNKIKMDRVYKKNNTIKKGTLLIEKCGGTKINPVGRIIIVEDDVRSYYTNFVQGVKVNDFMDSKYLYYQLQTTYNLRLHMSNVKQTTGIQNFNFMKFASEKVFLNPPLETQKKIADYLDIETEKADDEIEKLNRKNILLEELRNSLIFEAVTGKIDVGVEGEEYKKIISEF
jgi:type I restriction enzyme S subunit